MLDKINSCLLSIIDMLSENKLNDILIFDDPSGKNNQSGTSHINGDFMFEEIEQHEFFELCFVLEGRNIIQLQDRFYGLKQNQFCFIDRKNSHKIGWIVPATESFLLWVAVPDNMLRIHVSDYGTGVIEQSFGLDILDTNNFLLKEISKEIAEDKPDRNKAIVSYFKTFLFLLYRKIEANYMSMNTKWRNKIISEAEEYINDNYASKLTLKEISDAVAISPNYLSALFRQVTGLTINEYIRDTKIGKVKELLSNTELGLSEIALQLGFYDQFHLSKSFKLATGISPTEYKKSLNKLS